MLAAFPSSRDLARDVAYTHLAALYSTSFFTSGVRSTPVPQPV